MAQTTSTPAVQAGRYPPSRIIQQASGKDLDFCAEQVRRSGRCLELGRIEAAEACLRQGLALVPGHPECTAYLAVCLAAGKRKYVTAENLVRDILDHNPYDPTAWYALGRINLLGGRREQAFTAFAEAKRVSRNDAQVGRVVDEMDPRQEPVLGFLARDNFLNVALGRIRGVFRSG